MLSALDAALRAAFGFDARDFAQGVALSAVASACHGVAGVRAVDIDLLYRESGPQSSPAAHPLLQARPARTEAGSFVPAEILTLAPGPLDRLELMP